ncbi:hypothetical protein Tco_1090774, partial [Tanacetum coccineum]
FVELRENVKTRDNEDKLLDRKRHKDERIKEEKHKRAQDEVEDEMDQIKTPRMSKDQRYTLIVIVTINQKDKVVINTDAISLGEQHELALKLSSS